MIDELQKTSNGRRTTDDGQRTKQMTDRLPPSTLRLGLPSGSMQNSTVELLGRAGYKVTIQERSVFPRIDDEKISAVLFRAQEISRYVVDGIVHYCVANMPGAVARTSTFALNHATLPFALALADKGWRQALADDPNLRAGLNVHDGKITCEPVAEAHGLPYVPAEAMLGE